MTKPGAGGRAQRLLSIVPWIVDHPGAPVAEICTRFGIAEPELLQALEMLRYVGVYPFSPDALIDVAIEDGAVWLHLAQPFGRPLRLTPEEGLALVAAGRGLVDAPGADPDGSLARGLAKLAHSLGLTDEESIEVKLADGVAPEMLDLLRSAVVGRRQVAIEYYSHARDEHTARTIDPHGVYSDQGRWYVSARCHLAAGDRIFRVDRVQAAEVLEETFEPPDGQPFVSSFTPGPDAPRVVLDLDADARWVADYYPHDALEETDDGALRITLAVTARPWLDRLLLTLGPAASVRSVDPRLGSGDVRAEAAEGLLRRYRTAEATQ